MELEYHYSKETILRKLKTLPQEIELLWHYILECREPDSEVFKEKSRLYREKKALLEELKKIDLNDL